MLNFTKQSSEENFSPSPDPVLRYSDRSTRVDPAVSFKASSILKYLVIAILILLMLHFLVIISFQMGFKFAGIGKLYFDREDSLPTYFSSFLLLVSASILGLIAVLKIKDKDAFANHWAILAIIFLALSVDESVSLHESLIDPLRNSFQLTGFLKFSWVIAGGLFVLIFCFSYLKFFLALSKNMRIWFFISGAIYILGAIGFEMLGGNLFNNSLEPHEQSLTYQIVMTIEETIEMSGILLFIFTLLLYIKSYAPKINLAIK